MISSFRRFEPSFLKILNLGYNNLELEGGLADALFKNSILTVLLFSLNRHNKVFFIYIYIRVPQIQIKSNIGPI